MEKVRKPEFETKLRLTKEREIDIVNFIAECTVVENDLIAKINNHRKISDLPITQETIVDWWNIYKKTDPYYQKDESRKVLVDNCILNVIGILVYKNNALSKGEYLDKIGFKRQVTINNMTKNYKYLDLDFKKENSIVVKGIGTINTTKVIRTTLGSIEKMVLTRSGKMKLFLKN